MFSQSEDDELFDIPGLDLDPPSKAPEPASVNRPTQKPASVATPHPVAAPEGPASRMQTADKKIVNMTADIPVQVVAVLGKKMLNVKEIVSMRIGQLLELNRMPNEAIDLVVNGKLMAKGELVEIDGKLGVRILKIFD